MVALERLKLSHPKARLEEYRYVGRGMVALERLKPPARHLRDGGAVGRGMVALERLKLVAVTASHDGYIVGRGMVALERLKHRPYRERQILGASGRKRNGRA